MKSSLTGVLAALFANLIFGLNIPVTKALVAHWMTPAGYTIVRMFFGALAFWAFASLLRKEKVASRDLLTILGGGLLGYLGTQFLFSQSLKYTTPVIFALLIALTPVAALLLSALFLKEAVSRRKLGGMALSISGAFLVILSSGSSGTAANNALGILFVLLCVFAYAGYMVITRKVARKYSPVTVAKWMFLVSAAALIPFAPRELANQRIFSSEGTMLAFGLLAFALLFSTTLAFFLMPLALRNLEASTVSIFMNMQPIVASVVAIAIGQDSMTWDKGAAALLVLSGVYLVSVNKTKRASDGMPASGEGNDSVPVHSVQAPDHSKATE